MSATAQLILGFYTAFNLRDPQPMIAAYHPEATFKDEVFDLRGKQIGAMWHYLCENGKDMKINLLKYEANDSIGTATWEAYYTFSTTGRKVHNVIEATFKFKDGKIIEHRDRFKFWKWTRMALGPTGLFLGWTRLVRRKVQENAAKALQKFIDKHPEYQG